MWPNHPFLVDSSVSPERREAAAARLFWSRYFMRHPVPESCHCYGVDSPLHYREHGWVHAARNFIKATRTRNCRYAPVPRKFRVFINKTIPSTVDVLSPLLLVPRRINQTLEDWLEFCGTRGRFTMLRNTVYPTKRLRKFTNE
ncbi:hypothetical protein J6590_074897 [Homalodisca vitripennis]|nr:hypothetical protein J6590_074897 [Homalodisca vitripennis]